MPEQPYPLNARNPKDMLHQMQQLMDDLYQERLAGAQPGDVLAIDNETDILTLNVSSSGGLQKTGGELAVKPKSTGPITLTTDGVDVSQVSTSKPGTCPTLSNDDTQFLNGKGNWTVPATTGLTQNVTVVTDIGPPQVTATLHFTAGRLTSVT
jgi:hypothetical protein